LNSRPAEAGRGLRVLAVALERAHPPSQVRGAESEAGRLAPDPGADPVRRERQRDEAGRVQLRAPPGAYPTKSYKYL
jgi:hypothetical protein